MYGAFQIHNIYRNSYNNMKKSAELREQTGKIYKRRVKKSFYENIKDIQW